MSKPYEKKFTSVDISKQTLCLSLHSSLLYYQVIYITKPFIFICQNKHKKVHLKIKFSDNLAVVEKKCGVYKPYNMIMGKTTMFFPLDEKTMVLSKVSMSTGSRLFSRLVSSRSRHPNYPTPLSLFSNIESFSHIFVLTDTLLT